jgi:hypothetical protein
MEPTRLKFFVVGLLLAAPAAQAQFSNSSLSLGVQGNAVVSGPPQWGLSLGYSRYIESGFEFVAWAPALITEVPAGAETPSGAGRVFATGLSLGVRYLFLEEMVRPWVSLQLGSSILITTPVTWFVGPAASVGLDWVFSESFSLGLRGTYELFIDLNRPSRHQLGVVLGVSVLL